MKFKVGDKVIFPEINGRGNMSAVWTITKRSKYKYHPYKGQWKYWVCIDETHNPIEVNSQDFKMELHESSAFNNAMKDFLK